MIEPARLLGFAFANADLLFEIDAQGTILFATGAVKDFAPEAEIVGKTLAGLFSPTDAGKLVTLAGRLGPGDRAGPLPFTVIRGGKANVAMCRLPQNGGRISCTLARNGERVSPPSSKDEKTGLPAREGFFAGLGPHLEESDALALVNVPALEQACERLAPRESEKLLQRIGAAIRESGATIAGRLSPSSFGAVARAIKGKNSLAEAIRKALKRGGLGALPVEETLVSLKANGLSPEQRILAVRYVVDRFVAGEKLDGTKDLGAAFDELVKSAQTRALALAETVADGRFALVFQPIVDLKSGAVSHYEALTRFDAKESTGEIVGFAEALGIADAFDLAVLVKLLAEMEKVSAGPSVAYNLSGNTIMSPAAFGLLAGMLASRRALAGRLLIEVTETAELIDLPAANAAIQTLREMGFRVGIDDFGAGAASFNYLHALAVDFVKVDGSLVKKLGASERDDRMLGGIVKLCAELGVKTIAEYVENETQRALARKLGFDLGQGHCFGQAATTLPVPRDAKFEPVTSVARRRGTQESWQ